MVLIANHTDRYIVKILETISIYLIPNIDVKIGEHYFTGRYLEVVGSVPANWLCGPSSYL